MIFIILILLNVNHSYSKLVTYQKIPLANYNNITIAQVCFISFLNYQSVDPKCIGVGFSAKYPRYLYEEDNINEIFYRKINNGIFTSVWCTSTKTSGLRCNFKNLCYLPFKKQFIFIYSPSSIMYGIENILEMTNKLVSSSVQNHNAFRVPIATVNVSRYYNHSMSYVDRELLLVSRFKPDNLQHIFHDDLLPLYFTLMEFFNSSKVNTDIHTIIIDNIGKLESDYLYKAVTKKIYFISDFPKDDLICFFKSHIGLNKMSVFHQYGFNDDLKTIKTNVNKYQIDSFIKHFLQSFNLKNDFSKVPSHYEIVLLHRLSTRKIINIHDIEDNLKLYLEKEEHIKMEIKIVSLEHDGVIYIIKSLLRANLFIGMHGGALILSIFMHSNNSLIELWPYGLDPAIVPVYKIVCDIKGLNYQSWINKDIHFTKIHPEYPLYYGGIRDWSNDQYPELLKKITTQNLKNILCCDNPDWLLRIYQDTIVNVYPDLKLKSSTLQSIVKIILQIYFNNRLKLDNDVIPSNLQYLSQVEDVKCFITQGSSTYFYIKLELKWVPPWNVDDIHCNEVGYEILIKESILDLGQSSTDGKDIIHKYYTKDLIFKKRFTYNISSLKIWITSKCNNSPGGEIYLECK